MAVQTLNLKFVEEVEKHPCLYNYSLSEYSRKDITERAWNEVGKVVNLTGHECKEKWKNLRAVFVRHMKPSESPTKSKKPYYLADAMQFALPFIKTFNMNISGNHPKQTKQEVYYDDEENNGLQTLNSKIPPTLPSPHSYSSQPSPPHSYSLPPSSPEPSSNQLNYPIQAAKMVKRSKEEDLDDAFDEYMQTKKNRIDFNMDPQREANKMFLLSLLPDLSQMSPKQIRMFKKKTIDSIDEILENTESVTALQNSRSD